MKEWNHFLSLMEELTILLRHLLTDVDQNDMQDIIYYLRENLQELEDTNKSIKSTKVNDHDLATKVIAISGRCFGDIIQDLKNIRDIVKNVKKQYEKRE